MLIALLPRRSLRPAGNLSTQWRHQINADKLQGAHAQTVLYAIALGRESGEAEGWAADSPIEGWIGTIIADAMAVFDTQRGAAHVAATLRHGHKYALVVPAMRGLKATHTGWSGIRIKPRRDGSVPT